MPELKVTATVTIQTPPLGKGGADVGGTAPAPNESYIDGQSQTQIANSNFQMNKQQAGCWLVALTTRASPHPAPLLLLRIAGFMFMSMADQTHTRTHRTVDKTTLGTIPINNRSRRLYYPSRSGSEHHDV